MIEVGSYIGLAAMTRSEITIRNVNIRQLGIIPDSFRRLGIRIEERGDDLYIPRQEHYMIEDFIDGSILTVADAPWPIVMELSLLLMLHKVRLICQSMLKIWIVIFWRFLRIRCVDLLVLVSYMAKKHYLRKWNQCCWAVTVMHVLMFVEISS